MGRVFCTDLTDDDVAYDLIAIKDGRKAFQKSRMASVNDTAMRFFAFRKGAPVAFEALFVHGALFAQGAAEGGKFFRVVGEFMFRTVVNADLDVRQVIKIVQKFLHLCKVVFAHIRKLRYEITISLYK